MNGVPVLALAFPLLVALGLLVWEAFWPRSSAAEVPALALVALALSFGCAVGGGVGGFGASRIAGEALPVDGLAWVLNAIFLLISSLVLCTLADAEKRAGAARERYALFLLGVVGGVLAISARDLWLLGLGLALAALVAQFVWKREGGDEPARAVRTMGLGALCFGLALLYTSAGTLDMAGLRQFLWRQGGLRPPMLYAGVALAHGGIILLTGLLSPSTHIGLGGEGMRAALGLACLARMDLGALGALAWEWSGALILFSLLGMAWGVLEALRAHTLLGRMTRLDLAQRGLLLWALALAHRAEGLAALLLTLPAYAVARELLAVGLRLIHCTEGIPEPDRAQGGEASLTGLAHRNPWLGWPLLVSLLSLAGAPLTLGFVGRAATLWAAQEAGMTWLVAAGGAVSVLVGTAYLRAAFRFLRREPSAPRQPAQVSALHLALAVGALGLVLLGLYPLPLIRLAQRIVGAG